MGYVQINKIGISLPIYHGTDEAVLQIAIGHLTGSSLPVGGESTHCAVSGHRGLPSAKLFTDLDQLVEGDTFTLTVLDQTATYQVDQIRIVEPSDISNLEIAAGQDYCTLITCTPYGINTHRMLVRGHRIENIEGAIVVTSEAVRIPNYVVAPAVGVPMLFVVLAGMLIHYRRRPATAEGILEAEEKKKRSNS
jgi:sortase A